MAPAAIALMVAGTTLQAYGSYKEGKDKQAVDDYNAKVSDVEGEGAMQEANTQAEIQLSQDRETMSHQLVLEGASGIAGGTFTDALVASSRNAALNRAAILQGGALAKMRARSQAGLYKAQGSEAYSAGVLGAASTLATGYGKAGMAYSMSQAAPNTGTGAKA